MNFQTINKQRKIILLSTIVGIVSLFLPWITISTGSIFGQSGMGTSLNGFHDGGILVFLTFLSSGMIAWLAGNQTQVLEKTMWLATLIAGAVALLLILIFLSRKTGDMSAGFGLVEANFGFGVWIALAASIVIIAAAWIYKRPEDTLKNSFEGLTQGITSGTSSTPPDTSKASEAPPKSNKFDDLAN